jgi:secondary thiamine-phosphate synthase enzyme
MVDITPDIKRVVKEAGVSRGICTIYIPHTTAGVTINENADPSVKRDILAMLDKMAPANAKYSHAEGNADAHIKASIIGASATVIIENGYVVLGTWQGIFFCEFDGPRTRNVLIKIIPVK